MDNSSDGQLESAYNIYLRIVYVFLWPSFLIILGYYSNVKENPHRPAEEVLSLEETIFEPGDKGARFRTFLKYYNHYRAYFNVKRYISSSPHSTQYSKR